MTATATVADRHRHEPGVIGWIDERGRAGGTAGGPDRGAAGRSGSGRAAAARAPPEARQLRRWAAHVLFTELICGAAARELGLRPDAVAPLDPLAAVQLGSITGAAWQQAPAVGAVCRALFPAAAGGAGPERRAGRTGTPPGRSRRRTGSAMPSSPGRA